MGLLHGFLPVLQREPTFVTSRLIPMGNEAHLGLVYSLHKEFVPREQTLSFEIPIE